jgi:hypothetical protein
VTGLDVMPLGERGHTLLRALLDHLVEVGALRMDSAVAPHRYRARAPEAAEGTSPRK